MEHYEREFLIARIDSGYIRFRRKNIVLHINPPSKDILYEAQEVYKEALDDAYWEGIMDKDDAEVSLFEMGLWTEKDAKDLDTIPDNIEKLKVELYNAAYKSLDRKRIREHLAVHRSEQIRLLGVIHSWDHVTCEGIASYARWQHILHNSVTYPNGNLYDWLSVNITTIMHFFNECTLDEDDIRDLSRNEPWSTLWTIRKKSGIIFDEPMSIEQKALIVWSSIYDNIAESPECPHETILKDDDMLDGWLILQRKKREKEQKQKRGEEFSNNPRISGAQEVYLPAQTMEDADEIHELNQGYGKAVRRARLNQVAREGRVPLMKFGDIKQRLHIEATQKLSKTMKGG